MLMQTVQPDYNKNLHSPPLALQPIVGLYFAAL